MKIFIESIDHSIWNAFMNDPFVPITVVDAKTAEKTWVECNDVESKQS